MEDRTVVVDTENDVQYQFFKEHGTWFVKGTFLGTLLLADKKPPRIMVGKPMSFGVYKMDERGNFNPRDLLHIESHGVTAINLA